MDLVDISGLVLEKKNLLNEQINTINGSFNMADVDTGYINKSIYYFM